LLFVPLEIQEDLVVQLLVVFKQYWYKIALLLAVQLKSTSVVWPVAPFAGLDLLNTPGFGRRMVKCHAVPLLA
jgi:hypothetical protein